MRKVNRLTSMLGAGLLGLGTVFGAGMIGGCESSADPGFQAHSALRRGESKVLPFTYGTYFGDLNGDGMLNTNEFSKHNHTVFNTGQNIGLGAQLINLAGREFTSKLYRNGELIRTESLVIPNNGISYRFNIDRNKIRPYSTYEVYYFVDMGGYNQNMGKSIVQTRN